MSEVKLGIKETNEFMDGAVEAIKAGKKIKEIVEDGIDGSDIPKAYELVKEQADKITIYKAAYEGKEKILAELKDLDKSELIAIVMKVVDAVDQVEEA